ncbi:MAG: plastocyanin [Candidatus Latescibacterota bacterium]|jgi:plastocyanin
MSCRWIPIFLLFVFLSTHNIESATITGMVHLQDTEKTARPKRYYMGPYRSSHHTTKTLEGPQNTVIYIKGVTTQTDTSKAQPVEMTQVDEMFVPYVLPIQKGTSVGFPNEDAFYHNVFSVMSGVRFDLGRYAKGKTTNQTFDTPGVVVVRCEIHPGMKAYILVLDTPHFTVPSKTGVYTLNNIPPGTYQLFAWHPDQGTQTQTITVTDTHPTTANFSF